MEKRPALGKGLSALIPDAPEPRQGSRQTVLRIAGQHVHLARQVALQRRLSERRGQGRVAPHLLRIAGRQVLLFDLDTVSPIEQRQARGA